MQCALRQGIGHLSQDAAGQNNAGVAARSMLELRKALAIHPSSVWGDIHAFQVYLFLHSVMRADHTNPGYGSGNFHGTIFP